MPHKLAAMHQKESTDRKQPTMDQLMVEFQHMAIIWAADVQGALERVRKDKAANGRAEPQLYRAALSTTKHLEDLCANLRELLYTAFKEDCQ